MRSSSSTLYSAVNHHYDILCQPGAAAAERVSLRAQHASSRKDITQLTGLISGVFSLTAKTKVVQICVGGAGLTGEESHYRTVSAGCDRD